MGYIILLFVVSLISFFFGCILIYSINLRKYEEEPIENYLEALVLKKLRELNLYNKILNNLYILKENNHTSEIDLIFICCYGIFVIEVKQRSGWIFGNQKDIYWTVTYKNGIKDKMYNPIIQNSNHIKRLMKILNLKEDIFKSILVFNDDCVLKKIYYDSNKVTLSKLSNINSNMLKEFKYIILSKKQIDEIYNKLIIYTNPPFNIRKKHNDYIKILKNDK